MELVGNLPSEFLDFPFFLESLSKLRHFPAFLDPTQLCSVLTT